MPFEGNADNCQSAVSHARSTLSETSSHDDWQRQASVECRRPSNERSSDASRDPSYNESTTAAQDELWAPTRFRVAVSSREISRLHCEPQRYRSVEQEARSTVDMFRRVADGDGDIDSVFEEINRDRQAMGIGSRKERAYSDQVNRMLQEQELLPELGFRYAKDHFDEMSRRGKITEESYAKFRQSALDEMSPTERYLSKVFTNELNAVDPRGLFGRRYLNLKELNDLIDATRDFRIERAEQRTEFKEAMNFLAEDNGKNFDMLRDKKADGITRRSIREADVGPRNREILERILSDFREYSLQDNVITKADLSYCFDIPNRFQNSRYSRHLSGLGSSAPAAFYAKLAFDLAFWKALKW